MQPVSRISIAVMGGLFAVSVAAGAGQAQSQGAAGSLEQTYQPQWQDRSHVGITRALSSRQLRECAAYKYKRNTDKPHQYLVRCTDDGRQWRTFLIDTESGHAMGPYEPAPAYD